MSNQENKNPNADWLEALAELESLDRRREQRRAIERKAAGGTPPPVPQEEGAARAPEPSVEENAEQFAEETRAVTTEEAEDERPASPPQPAAARNGKADMSRYEELCKKPSMKVKSTDIAVMDELSDVLCAVSHAAQALTEFRERFGECFSEEKYKLWEDNLRDVSSVMLREFHNMRHGREKKTYDKRNVCKVCHSVFMVPIPGGICDECRSKMDMTPRPENPSK